MSKPSETASLRVVPAGEILEPVRELTDIETHRAKWQGLIKSGEEILDLAPQKWLVREWLPLDAIGVVYAPPATGKSFYLLSLAFELARGGAWCGTQLTEPLKVLYIAGERATALRDRAEAWKTFHAETIPAAFDILPTTPQLTKQSQVDAICQEIEARGSRVVIIDTYAKATLGINENDSGDTGEVYASLERIKEATQSGLVIVVHHTTKAGSSGMDSMRGSSALAGAAEIAIQLDKKDRGIEAQVTMTNLGDTPPPMFYKLEPVALPVDDDGWVRSGAVMVETTAAPYRKQTDKVLLEILQSFDLPEGFSRVNAEQVLGLKKSHAGQLLKELREAGDITNLSPFTARENGSKYFLTEKGRARAEELESLEIARKKREGS